MSVYYIISNRRRRGRGRRRGEAKRNNAKIQIEIRFSKVAGGKYYYENPRSNLKLIPERTVKHLTGSALVPLGACTNQHTDVTDLGWRYLSNTTCLMRPDLFSTALLVQYG